MLQQILIGNIGADAQFQEKDGRKFTTFRVAHNDSWTDANGTKVNKTVWVDCILPDHPKVAEYLKQGQQVVVIGSVSLRVYSSQKDRCMKAGMTINVHRIELLGGASDAIPSRLYDANGVQHDVTKYYWTDVKGMILVSLKGQQYQVDDNGWVSPVQVSNVSENQESNDAATF